MLLLAAPKKLHWWLKSLNRKQLIMLGVALVFVIGGVGYAITSMSKEQPIVENSSVEPPEEPPQPTTIASRMTGVQVAFELNELPVTGVMIENSPDARPQAGLRQADLVYEAIAEGGITRFLALYQESKPEHIGPVRSARPYYLDFLKPYDGAIVHAGGSAVALAQIRNEKFKDIDHGANGSTFTRVSNRFAPHNLYTSRDRLLEAHERRGYMTSKYTGLARKEADSPAETPTASTIDMNISSPLYAVHYDYDPVSNSYNRVLGGKPHTDERSGKQIKPKVVVALVMSFSQKGIYSVYGTAGSGTAFVFQDGIAVKGIWEKDGRSDQLVLKDDKGAVLPLNPGQTWITLIKNTGQITHAP